MKQDHQLINLLLATLRELEFGWTPNSGYRMCNSCEEVDRPDLGKTFQHGGDCKWKAAVSAAKLYLSNAD
jgi:hypothetical protein